MASPRPPNRPLLALALALGLAGMPGTPARGDPPELTAPLGGGTPGPIRQLFLDPVLADARAVGAPALALRLESANSWSVPTVLVRAGRAVSVQLDAESDALAISARLPWSWLAAGGWRSRVATTLSWRLTSFWGGFTDGGIEAWHHLIGAFDFERNLYPRDRVALRLEDGTSRAFDLRSARLAPGDLVLGTQVLLAMGGASLLAGAAGEPRWGVAARLDLKLPTGSLDRAGGSGGFDAGVSVLASADLAPWLVAHAMVFATAVSKLASRVALQPRALQYGADASLVFVLGGWAFVAEDRVLSPLLGGGWTVVDGGDDEFYISSAFAALFRAHNQITVGVRRGPLTLAFSEDFTPGPNPRGALKWFYDSNAPDVVFALTYRTRL